jgi:Polyketide cyclase / dehydrase and lipid transport
MTVAVCPVALVDAPPDRVWQLLTAGYETWADARVEEVQPPGPAAPGQRIRLSTSALGRWYGVLIEVLDVDAERRRLRLAVHLPFRIEEIGLFAVDPAPGGRSRTSFG